MTKDTNNTVSQSKLEANTCGWRKARENGWEGLTIRFGFTSDWMRKRREIFGPIVRRSDAKQLRFDILMKTVLISV